MSIEANYSKNQESRNNSVNFMSATLVGGVGIAWGIVNPASALGYLATTVVGAVGSVFTYGLGGIAYKYYDKWCHRTASPLLVKEKTVQYENSLTEAFEKLKHHSCYEKFKIIRGYESDEEAFSFLQTNLKLGYCFGSITSLLQIIDKNPHASCPDLLKSMDLSQVFYFQLVHFMLAGFQVAENRVQRDLRWARPTFIVDEINLWNQRKGLPLVEEDPDKLQKAKQLEELARSLQQIITEIQKSFIPWEELQTEPFSIKESSQTIRMNLEQLLKSENISVNSTIVGRIILRGDQQDQRGKDYTGGHTIVFQCSPGRYRFYDTINADDGGFYEYDNKTEFYEALRTQLLEDLMQCKNPQIQVCIKK